MGLWTKAEREAAKAWVAENEAMMIERFTDGWSINGIRNLAPMRIGRTDIEEVLKRHGLTPRGLAQNGKPLQVELAKKTSVQKFGYENASSSPAIKYKREQTFLNRLGVKNPFQDQAIKDQITQGHIEKYGVPNPGIHSPKRVKISNPHRRLSDALNNAGVQHQNEVPIYRPDVFSKMKAPRVDILIGDLIVEVFGDYFHANPLKYRPNDLISLFKGQHTAEEIRSRDLERLQKFHQCGYRTLVIWEHDIRMNLQESVKRIQHELANHQD